MGHVIAVANMKGGVGKTATIIGLAEALAAGGDRVLVIDLDPQASASICLTGDHLLAEIIRNGQTVEVFVEDRLIRRIQPRMSDYIRRCVSGVTHKNKLLQIDLLASSPALRMMERELIFELTHQNFGLNAIVGHLSRMMDQHFNEAMEDYDVILLDCAPGISALTEVSIRLADLVVVPTIPDFLSTTGLEAFCDSIWRQQQNAEGGAGLVEMRLPHVLITRRRPTTEHQKTSVKLRNEMLADEPNFSVFDTEIPEAAAVAEALSKFGSDPTFGNKWGDKIAPLLDRLRKEVKGSLNGA